jgi:hypothetical protein
MTMDLLLGARGQEAGAGAENLWALSSYLANTHLVLPLPIFSQLGSRVDYITGKENQNQENGCFTVFLISFCTDVMHTGFARPGDGHSWP